MQTQVRGFRREKTQTQNVRELSDEKSGTKSEKATGRWKKLHNECYALYSSTNTVRMIKAGERNAYWILVAKPEGKTPRRIWENNTQTSRRDVDCV